MGFCIQEKAFTLHNKVLDCTIYSHIETGESCMSHNMYECFMNNKFCATCL